MNENLSYPIGKYQTKPFSQKQKDEWLLDLKFLPSELELAVQNLDEAQLQTLYRDGGWTVQQLVHHVADSHMNSFIRFRLTLTENNPTIKPYDQDAWAHLDDVKLPINISLTLLHSLHRRLVAMLENLPDDAWQRTFYHPEHEKQMTLWYLLGLYAWHGKHHTAHIKNLRERMNW